MYRITNEPEHRYEKVCANPACLTIFGTNHPKKKYCDDGCKEEHYQSLGEKRTTSKAVKRTKADRLAMLNNQFLMMPLV